MTTAAVTAAFACVAGTAGCAGSSVQPNAASSASVVPGAAPSLGEASQGALSVTVESIQRVGTKLTISASIHNSGAVADELEQIGSQVTPTITLSPAVVIPAGGTVELGGSGASAVLDQQGRLEPGGTLDLTLQFKKAGQLQVFSSFQDATSH